LTLFVGIGLLAAACTAQAQYLGVSIGHHGVSVGIGAPVCAAPSAVISAPAPVYYSAPSYAVVPQTYCAPPAVAYTPAPVCAPAPVYVPGYYSYRPAVVIGGGYGGWQHGYRGRWEHRGWRR